MICVLGTFLQHSDILATDLKLAVLVHADVVGSTTLVQLNEKLAHDRIQDVFRRFAATIEKHHGTTHEIRGDALVAEFPKGSDAVTASLAYQVENATYLAGLSDEIRPAIRIGIAIGEVIIADNTITGEGVILAQRLEQLAEPGGVCIQDAAYQTVPKRLPFTYQDLGERKLKGFDDRIRVFRVCARDDMAGKPANMTDPDVALPELFGKLTLAVLPFTNMSGDSEQEYFSDGISEDIITELSRYRELQITSRNSAFTFKGKSVNVQEIGRELGVSYVLEGSVRKSGNRIRVTAQLIDAVSGNHIWAERYDRELDDIFAVQDELTRSIAAVLPTRVQQSLVDTASHRSTIDLTAYDLFLRGRWIFAQSSGEDHSALELFEQAIRIDPLCTHAYAALAFAYSYSRFSLRSPLPDYDHQSKSYIEKALQYGSGDSGIHALAAMIYTCSGDHQLGNIHAEKAIVLNRNDIQAISTYGFVKAYSGAPADALPWFEEARRLDPLSPNIWIEDLAECHYLLGNYQASIDIYLSWRNPPLHTYTHLAACYAQLDLLPEAENFVSRYEQEKPKGANFQRYAEAHITLCQRKEDAEHWMQGYRKAGLIE
jgi:adenylate cyclase